MFVSPGRALPQQFPGIGASLQQAAQVFVVITSFALFAISVSGLVDFATTDLLGCAIGMSAITAASLVANIRRGDATIGLAAVVHLLIVLRGSLSWWPVLVGGWTNAALVVLAVPAFLGIGVVGISIMAPHLRDRTDRRPAIVLIVGVMFGWWSILVFAVLTPAAQASLRTPAVAAIGISTAIWITGHILLFRPRRNLHRTEMVMGLAALTYFIGDAYGILGEQWHTTAMIRVLTCAWFGLAALRSHTDSQRPVLSASAVLRPRQRDLALMAVVAPMALSIIPLLVWVVSAADTNASWFPPLWVGGTLFVVLSLSVALAARMPDTMSFEPDLPDPAERRLYYQPILRANDGAIIGAEALFRVVDADGVRSGGSIFEELIGSSKLAELTDWIIDEALREGHRFLESVDDPEAFVSFNMSPDEFTAPTLIERIDAALLRSGRTADGFMIEVTELAFLQASEEVEMRVQMLQDRGFLVALDDFGSGYASLHSIVEVDFDLIKIDRSIIVSAAKPRGEHLLRRTIDLLSGAGLLVLAEGVEDEAQAALVRRQRPHFVQGYATGRPMPIDDLLGHLTSGAITHTHQVAET